jgi:hypothetical protein
LIYRIKNVTTIILLILLVDTLHFGCKGYEIITKCKAITNCEYYGTGEEVGATLHYVADPLPLRCGVNQFSLLENILLAKTISLGPIWAFLTIATLRSVV